jgi:hypothetical protein
MSGGRRFSVARQAATIAYIVSKFPEGISRSKLRVLLFLIDLESFRRNGKSITGATYRKGKTDFIVQGLTRSLNLLRKRGEIQ